jgi:hypothetical protein
MLPLQGTTHHHPTHRVPEAAGPLPVKPDPAKNDASERYVGFDLLLTQAVEEPPHERRTKRKGK